MFALSRYFLRLLQDLGKAMSSAFIVRKSFLKSAINLCKSVSFLDIIILIASLILPLQTCGVEDLTASIPIIFNLGSDSLTPSSSNTFNIYLFLATHIPLLAITSRFITIQFLKAFV